MLGAWCQYRNYSYIFWQYRLENERVAIFRDLWESREVWERRLSWFRAVRVLRRPGGEGRGGEGRGRFNLIKFIVSEEKRGWGECHPLRIGMKIMELILDRQKTETICRPQSVG